MDEVVDVNDHTKSQSFLSDFVHFLDNIAKQRIRTVNLAIFPQIMGNIV